MRIILWVLLIGCMLVLSRYILFKKGLSYYKQHFTKEYKTYNIKDGWKSANKNPFSTIRIYSRNIKQRESYKNIGGNLIGFVPLGFLIPLLLVRVRGVIKVTAVVFLISLLFETTQLLFGLGEFDVDDLILNAAGGTAGYLLFLIVKWVNGLNK